MKASCFGPYVSNLTKCVCAAFLILGIVACAISEEVPPEQPPTITRTSEGENKEEPVKNEPVTAEEEKQSYVIVLDDTTFEEALKSYPEILIEFYAPWFALLMYDP